MLLLFEKLGDEGSRGDEHTAIARTEVDDKVYVPDEQEAPSDKVPETTISKSTIRVCSSSTTSGDKLVADAGDPLNGGIHRFHHYSLIQITYVCGVKLELVHLR
ncbi:hypothetical protein SOVF_091690 [Spinacia oleracea]|nr:hypothetical protein SOVF_091690 [Spinacia oleracea]